MPKTGYWLVCYGHVNGPNMTEVKEEQGLNIEGTCVTTGVETIRAIGEEKI